MTFDHKHGNIYSASIHLFSQKCKINIILQSLNFFILLLENKKQLMLNVNYDMILCMKDVKKKCRKNVNIILT
jgi:hypothetical protein